MTTVYTSNSSDAAPRPEQRRAFAAWGRAPQSDFFAGGSPPFAGQLGDGLGRHPLIQFGWDCAAAFACAAVASVVVAAFVVSFWILWSQGS